MSQHYDEIGKIFIRSFIHSFKWSFWKWFFSSVSTTGATILFATNFLDKNLTREESLLIGLKILLGIFVLRFFLIFGKSIITYLYKIYKNSTYGEAIILLNTSFAAMHHYRKDNGHNDLEFMKAMVLLCNNLKVIYSTLTKSECSVSIKVPISNNIIDAGTLVQNLVRDTDSKMRDTDAYHSTQHTLLGNTAFSSCLNKVSMNSEIKHYINNHVNSSENYENTSKLCNPNGILPYNSELVMPITPIKGENTCLGFICIDSDRKDAFTSKYEVAILEGVSDGIFDIINTRNQFKLEEDEQKMQA